MNDELKKNLARKFTSRKFWMAVAGFIANILVLAGGSAGTTERITAMIMAGGMIIAYIIGEGFADGSPKEYNYYYQGNGEVQYGDAMGYDNEIGYGNEIIQQ